MSIQNTIDIYTDAVVFRSLVDKTISEIIDDEITKIGSYAFCSCSQLTSVSFPAVTRIGASAFQSCSALTSVSFPSATSIGNCAFQNCSALTTALFPIATYIGNHAFRSCSVLTTVVLGNESSIATAGGKSVFYQTSNAIVYVPDALVSGYKVATNWSIYASRIKGISELPS